MKKYLFIILFSLVLIALLYVNFTPNKEIILNEKSKEEIKPTGMNSLAIMLQNEKGEYVVSNSDTWPTSDYQFNSTLSSCENGGKLSWNEETKSITLKTSGSDKCYVYFDKTIIAKNIEKLVNDAKNMTSLPIDKNYNSKAYSGELFFHNGTYKDSDNTRVLDAADGGYRYSGDNPNNFVCFGPGVESYNLNGETCEDKNLYRIIGIVPVEVEKEDGTTETQKLIKLIQSEYATHDQLGKDKADGTPPSNNGQYNSLKRVKFIPTEGIQWNDVKDYTWNTSTLKRALNEEYIKYLQKNNSDTTWTNKIENVNWNVGSITDTQRLNSNAIEVKKIIESKSDKVSAQIGLMYLYDYGFASDKSNWNINVESYLNKTSRENDWLFNGVTEWTINYQISDTDSNKFIVIIDYDGSTSGYDVYGCLVLRPTFYLKQDVLIIDGNGTAASPYRIAI